MRSAILDYIAGIACLQIQANLPSFFIIVLLGTGMLILVCVQYRLRHFLSRVTTLASAGACFGFAWAAIVAHFHLSKVLPPEWEGGM